MSPSPTTTYVSTARQLGRARSASTGTSVVVDDDHLVFRVVHDVGELLGEQRMLSVWSTTPITGDREVRLEVLLGVPHEGADAVARLDAETRGAPPQPVGAPRDVGERASLAARVALEGDHLARAVSRLAPWRKIMPTVEAESPASVDSISLVPFASRSDWNRSVPGFRCPPSPAGLAPGLTRRSSCGCPPSPWVGRPQRAGPHPP